jgi:Neuraminidase (sialidase)
MIKILLFISFFFSSIFDFLAEKNTNRKSEITICQTNFNEDKNLYYNVIANEANVFIDNDPTKSYSMPLLSNTTKGDVMLSWTEKDEQGITSFCMAFSKDNGKTFSEKKTIFAGTGIGNNRMFRARVLSKKDGSFVAVFANRGEATTQAAQGGRGGGRSSGLVYSVSKDAGNTWTSPLSVDTDPTQGIMRGFFDAILMPNDEIAIAYLKDVANSTKHEERDLRLVISKNGILQPEKLIDAVVCDCCPINLLIDANGSLNVIYRDNNDDIRDMAAMISTDNGATFSAPKIIHNDGWKIQGCPHSGAVSSIAGKSALVAYYSGSEKEPGVRLTTREGKKLLILENSSAKNPYLTNITTTNLLIYEQIDSETKASKIAYRKISNEVVSETFWLNESTTGTNPASLSIGNQVIVAYEIKQANNKTGLKISTISL